MSTPDAISLESQRDDLYRRLGAGYAKVERGLAAGDPRATAWEDFWLGLLREYERVCDELRARGVGD